MTEHLNTIIVGGGQGGLSTGYHLKQNGSKHIILEKADQSASVWRHRWDSFTLITPNWLTRLPGAEYQGTAPDGFMARDDLIGYFEDYIDRYELPVQYGTRVTSVQSNGSGYKVSTGNGDLKADNVVIAAGFNQQPKAPPFTTNLSPEINQLHSHDYRNPGSLPGGAVLVVGSAQSG